ncbi:MAG TPA: hypothetical protein ENK44_04180 [Caldithrix abyssi]|uniref:Peptidase S9 prolyl oligopeptidase catalytic domain-containing protein n=1 Tax=Caldithrix abyssi TaxID=187145 RepID=A0A7V4TYR4_CALAY|nr:hypothetical protein [Caldithrix abyssi]
MKTKYALTIKSGVILIILAAFFTVSCQQEVQAPTETNLSPSVQSQALTLSENGLTCIEGTDENGALYRICMPDEWNGDLVVFAHGYVAPYKPVELPDTELDDGRTMEEVFGEMGYASAISSYRDNGLVVPEAVIDLVNLVFIFKSYYPHVKHIYLIGGSEGGLVTVKSLETKKLYDGGLALCGPIGSFAKQLNYFGDFKLVFDYFFPGILPGSPAGIPQEVMDNWDSVYMPAILEAITNDPVSLAQVISVTRAPVDPNDIESVAYTTLAVLWYNVFATNDAIERLGGLAFDNSSRYYRGSLNDAALNKNIPRYSADPQALQTLNEKFETSGIPNGPMVTMHTALDPIVPYWHEPLYRKKFNDGGLPKGFLTHFPVMRYGHCNFTAEELMKAFALLVLKVEGRELIAPIVTGKIPDKLFQ